MSYTLAACSPTPDNKHPLTAADLDSIAQNPACVNPQIMNGDPDYWGSAVGLYCLPASGLGVVIRVYDQDDATAKIIDNWADLINSDNQIAYGDNWFATGPASTLETLLADVSATGPQTTPPASEQPTDDEANEALCSSITYGILSQILVGGKNTADLRQYYDSYPGLEDLVTSISAKASTTRAQSFTGDDLLLTAALTEYDNKIKHFCETRLP